MGNELADYVEQNDLLQTSIWFDEKRTRPDVESACLSILQKGSVVQLSVPQKGHYTVALVNLNGRKRYVASKTMVEGVHSFNISEMTAGYRICEVTSLAGFVIRTGMILGW